MTSFRILTTTLSRHAPAFLAPLCTSIMLSSALLGEDAITSAENTAMAVVALLAGIWFLDGVFAAAEPGSDRVQTFLGGIAIGPAVGFFFVQAAYGEKVGNAALAAGAHRVLAAAFVVSLVLVAARVIGRRRHSR